MSGRCSSLLSSSTWRQVIDGEKQSKLNWDAKYGHMFPDEDAATPDPSRPNTSRSQASSMSGRGSVAPSRQSTRQTNRSDSAQSTDAKRAKLIQLRQKLMAALEDVDSELTSTQQLRSNSRGSSKASRR